MLHAVVASAHPPPVWGRIREKHRHQPLHLEVDEKAEHHHAGPSARAVSLDSKAHLVHKPHLPAGTTVHAVSANLPVGHFVPPLSLVSGGPARAAVTVGSMQILGMMLLALLLRSARTRPEGEDPLFRPKNVKRP
jgi:hypothetical protein